MKTLGDRQAAIGLSVVFAESEKGDVRREKINRLLLPLVQLDL
jgi:hypothetical protein